MDPEGTMLSEITRQRKKNTIMTSLNVESRTKQSNEPIDTEQIGDCQRQGVGSQKIHNSSYKINNPRDAIVTIVNNTVLNV